ncbi:MAG: hypothetical protein HYY25_13265 [Candidatus Wallbacteria bacterium]|nr:hypothetical protein [Candidatus Wallbacteria bacterium]
MTQYQTIYVAVMLTVTGLVLLLPAWSCLRRGARLYAGLADHAVLGAMAGIAISLAAAFAALWPAGSARLFQDDLLPRLVSLGAFGVLVVFILSRLVPDTWIVGEISERDFQQTLDKALAQAELDPERTTTGLAMAPDVTLRLYYWRRGARCLMEWHPRGSAARFPEFRRRFEELLSAVDCPARRQRALTAAMAGLACLCAGLLLLTGGLC